jgi:hypothetical protein
MLNFDDISIVIRTVSAHRMHLLQRLQQQLKPLDFVISDRSDRQNTYADDWFNAMRKGQDQSKKWLIHLEDDAFLSPDWKVSVLNLLNQIPLDIKVCSFYSGKRMKPEFQGLSKPHWEYLRGSAFFMHQCTAWKMEYVDYFVDGIKSQWASHPEYRKIDFIDQALMDFMVQKKEKFARVFPSLVQHTGDKSLIGHANSKSRQSSSFTYFYGDTP